MSAGFALEVRGLRFAYPATRTGERPFSLEVEAFSMRAGERVALFGPSGCGKSTFLELIAGERVPRAGELVVEGEDVARLGESERRAHRVRRVGFVFQDYPLVPHLAALDNVLLPFRINAALTLDAGARERSRTLLAELGLAGKEARRPGELSAGERQRVAIARALAPGAPLLLADEPTAGLDRASALRVLELVDAIAAERGLSVIAVTHDLSLLERFDRALDAESLFGAGAKA